MHRQERLGDAPLRPQLRIRCRVEKPQRFAHLHQLESSVVDPDLRPVPDVAPQVACLGRIGQQHQIGPGGVAAQQRRSASERHLGQLGILRDAPEFGAEVVEPRPEQADDPRRIESVDGGTSRRNRSGTVDNGFDELLEQRQVDPAFGPRQRGRSRRPREFVRRPWSTASSLDTTRRTSVF